MPPPWRACVQPPSSGQEHAQPLTRGWAYAEALAREIGVRHMPDLCLEVRPNPR